jgi:hypothetical protein
MTDEAPTMGEMMEMFPAETIAAMKFPDTTPIEMVKQECELWRRLALASLLRHRDHNATEAHERAGVVTEFTSDKGWTIAPRPNPIPCGRPSK